MEKLLLKFLLAGSLDINMVKIEYAVNEQFFRILKRLHQHNKKHSGLMLETDLLIMLKSELNDVEFRKVTAYLEASKDFPTELNPKEVLQEAKVALLLRQAESTLSEVADAGIAKDRDLMLEKSKDLYNIVQASKEKASVSMGEDIEENLFFLDSFSAGLNEITTGLSGLTIIGGMSGSGKALANSELVLTTQGFKPMGSITYDDLVVDSTGKGTEVIGVFPQGVRDIYTVTFKDGTKVNCDLEHKWSVRRKSKKELLTLTTKELLDTGYKIKRWDNRYNTWQNQYSYFLPQSPSCEFGIAKELPIHPYLLGLLLGDGGFTHCSTPKFTNSDRKLVDKVIQLLPQGDSIGIDKFEAGAYHISIIGGNTKRALEQLNLWNHLSISKFIPEDYLNSPLAVRELVYQGLIDTDGYVIGGHVVEFSTSSKKLSEDFTFLARSIGKVFSEPKERVGKYKKNNEIHIVNNSYRCTELKRKEVSIINIEYSHKEEATCIEVASNDHLFITNGFKLTHNSFYSIQEVVNQWHAGNSSLFFSLEMPAALLEARIMSAISGINLTDLIKSKLKGPRRVPLIKTEADKEIYWKQQFKAAKHKIFILDDVYDMNEISANIMSYSINNDIKLVVIDYINLASSSASGDAWKGLSMWAKDLNRIAIQRGLVILSPSQVTVQENPDGSLGITTRGSSELLNSASLALLLYRNEETRAAGLVALHITKTRNGEKAVIALQDNLKVASFIDVGILER